MRFQSRPLDESTLCPRNNRIVHARIRNGRNSGGTETDGIVEAPKRRKILGEESRGGESGRRVREETRGGDSGRRVGEESRGGSVEEESRGGDSGRIFEEENRGRESGRKVGEEPRGGASGDFVSR